jgi:hypothetical protein
LEVKNGVASGKILAGDGIAQSENGPWHEAKSVGGLEFKDAQKMEGLSEDQVMQLLGEYEYVPEEFPQADEVKQIEESPAPPETPPEDAPVMPVPPVPLDTSTAQPPPVMNGSLQFDRQQESHLRYVIVGVVTVIVVVGLIFGVHSLRSKANAEAAYQEAVENYERAQRARLELMKLSVAVLEHGRFIITLTQLKGLEAMKVQGDAFDKSMEYLRQADREIEQAYQEFDAACRKAGKENPYMREMPVAIP